MPPAAPPPLRRARAAVFATFFACGLAMGIWLVSIPAVQASTGISHAVLGGLILLLGLGGVLGMQASGALSQRVGSRPVTVVFLVLLGLAIVLPLQAGGAATLGAALVVFGLMNGAVDVAMNDQAVLVEREYGRPIMSAFHALWSVGGAVGALLGAGAQRLQLPLSLAAAVGTLVAVVSAVAVARHLIGRHPAEAAPQAGADGRTPAEAAPAPRLSGAMRRRVFGFAALAFLLMLSEGVANDWAALHAVEHLGLQASTAGLSYAVFAVSMTLGRLTVDRVAGRFGPAFVVRYGSALAATGLVLVMLSPVFVLTAAGWCLFGLGLAGVVPQLFTAAGAVSPARQSIIMSRVVGAGYVGQLAGPAIVGAAAGVVGLNLALLLPFLFCLLGIAIARIVTPDRSSEDDAGQDVGSASRER
ncbi:MFS transporter [Brachybacterium saurashtrense]|uniref:MFS transporter n=1 Tax=Brachybacterium saurashtrense TaxID=556288 RepID=A0A345YRJ7_9MICO|nr:MFS transporter [Brachybacterium saurashtrense]RRR24290.1 MFS transporter [Brachybacterium saurashtrense]